MFGIEALELARMQFAFTVSFHILFPAITIGLASYLAVLEGLWLRTNNQVYRDLYHFWSKIFAVNFGMGVVFRPGHGLPVRYQLEPLLRLRRRHYRSAAHLRGADRVLPRGWLPGGHAVWLEPCRPWPALLLHGDGGARHLGLDLLDPRLQQLDADPARSRDHRRPGCAGGLAGSGIQPLVPLPPDAHGHCRIRFHRVLRRCLGGLAPAARA